jgi:DNA-binding response OmpR family regulator
MSSHVLCVSWNPALASTRELLLSHAGFEVTSADEANEKCKTKADLLVLGHSVPREEKGSIIHCFRKYSSAPVLSLLRPGQSKTAQ